MNSPVVDLSQLAPKPPVQPSSATGSYVIEVDEAGFSQLANKSMQYPVILEVTMPSEPQTHGVSQVLSRLANSADGRWLLARVDVNKYPQIAQALGVQAVPTVVALIGGQVAPLFQGTADEANIAAVVEEVLKVAVQNGVAGRVAPAEDAAGDDPRFAAADEAMAAGDFAKAVEELEKLIAANPRDAEAIAGKAQAQLLLRTQNADPQICERADAAPLDKVLQLDAADFEMLTGRYDKAFDRLITLIGSLPSDQRDDVKQRLFELFNTVDPADSVLLNARRRLSTVLF